MNNSLEICETTDQGILSTLPMYWHGMRSGDSGINLEERERSQGEPKLKLAFLLLKTKIQNLCYPWAKKKISLIS